MSKDYIVLSQRVAGFLMLNGFVLQKIKTSNKDNVKRNIFIFRDSPELIECIHKYKSNK